MAGDYALAKQVSEVVDEIEALEAEVQAAGLPACKWGDKNPYRYGKPKDQADTLPETGGPMCTSCDLRAGIGVANA